MAEVDAVTPIPRYPSVGPEGRGEEPPKRRRKAPANTSDDGLTDDAGETPDEAPLLDDYA